MTKRRNTPPRVDLTGRRFGMLVVIGRRKMPSGKYVQGKDVFYVTDLGKKLDAMHEAKPVMG